MLKILQIIQEKFVVNFATNNNEIISTLFKSNYSKMMKQEIRAQEIIMVSVHHHHDCTECLSSESKHCPQAALQSLYTTRYACRKIQVWREWFCPNYNKIFFVYAKLVALCSALFVLVKIFIRKLPQIQLNPHLIHLLSNLMCHSLPPKI